VVVVSPNADWNWIPSNIWVGVGRMPPEAVTFPLAPVYRRQGIEFRQAKAVAIWPEGDGGSGQPAVDIVSTLPGHEGEQERLGYDYLINATGPKLNFAATPGLGPDGNSLSVCTPGHAVQAARALAGVIEKLRAGQRQTLVIGVGHGMCTCEGAAFEYTFNVEHELRTRGLRDLADVVYLSNEYELGDFGVGGMVFRQQGFISSSQIWTESLFRERGVKAILRAHIERVEPGKIYYETLDGARDTLAFDFAMLLPPFRGADLKAYDRAGADITADLFAPSGFLKVDADYTPKQQDQWRAEDWPETYQSPGTPTCSGSGSPSPRRTPSPPRAPAPTARSSPRRRRVPACRPR
jgi:sulfide:quinone oxidoreductase